MKLSDPWIKELQEKFDAIIKSINKEDLVKWFNERKHTLSFTEKKWLQENDTKHKENQKRT